VTPASVDATEPIRIVRIISRLNIGGPAIQAVTLTRELEPLGYATTLIRGREGPDEGSMDDLAQRLGVHPVLVASLRREVGWRDALALPAVMLHLRRARPALVHTHAAKAGTIGRLAALLAFPPSRRPVLVHTFHGHSLAGYWSSRRNSLYRRIERWLARRTDRLIAVSEEVRDELVGMGVAPADKFAVIRVGFDLSPFVVDGDERARRRAAARAALGVGEDERVVTTVARLVPIKRVDRFLRVASAVSDERGIRFLIVGDGELGQQLRALPEAAQLGDRVVWAGFRHDMPDVYFASDVVVQTSDNEGTPVALIEAQAAGVPVVSTRVGGVATVVEDGLTGRVVDVGDDQGLAAAVREQLSARAQVHERRDRAVRSFGLDRLIHEIAVLYDGLLART
jgi:glycosyltransferase involved in cell wall biosynthesis